MLVIDIVFTSAPNPLDDNVNSVVSFVMFINLAPLTFIVEFADCEPIVTVVLISSG